MVFFEENYPFYGVFCRCSLHYEKFTDGTVKCIEDEIPFEVPAGWSWSRLSAITIDIFAGGDKPDKCEKNPTEIYNIPIYSNGIENNGLYGFTNKPRVVEPSITISARGTIGFCCIRETPYVPIVRLITITPSKIINLYYLKTVFEALIETGEGSSIPQLTVPGIKPKLIPVPPVNEQARIQNKLHEILNYIANISYEKEELQQLLQTIKSKILDLAIRGKLIPQDSNDEPASVLLERIRAEKEELIKQGKIKRDKKESTIFRGDDNSYYHKLESDQGVSVEKISLPEGWAACSLVDVTYMVGNKDNQIQTNRIEAEGKYPVISQGQDYIDGYCNTNDKVVHDLPLVMFGDHTRNVKYVNMPFVIGADGTKFHKAIILNSKYLLYWMCYAADKLRDRGYARHYSLLKKEALWLPPLNEQKYIVQKIEQYFQYLDEILKHLS